jgi:CheY-like chemotaxis protein
MRNGRVARNLGSWLFIGAWTVGQLELSLTFSLSPTAAPNIPRLVIPECTRLGVSLLRTHALVMMNRTEQPAAPPIPEAVIPTIQLPKPGFPRKKILLIDDDAVILKILSFSLKSRGYEVVTATDGAEAIGLMHDQPPDLLLIDVGLAPDVNLQWDGFQVADWLHRMSGRIPTIMISGADKVEFAERAAASGAQAFFAKPIDVAHLFASIATVLAGNSLSITVGCN